MRPQERQNFVAASFSELQTRQIFAAKAGAGGFVGGAGGIVGGAKNSREFAA